jgi:N-acetylmuramoyl-L-alanine amidase
MVVDIEGLSLNATLKDIVAKIQADDPYIRQVRVGQNRPNVVRLVFDLKEEVKPQVFTLKPFGEYQHRLVFDLYPIRPSIESLIEQDILESSQAEVTKHVENAVSKAETPAEVKPAQEKKPKSKPAYVIALDPGHGGEDPGAVGKNGSREKDVVLKIAKRLKSKLEDVIGAKVVLTRDGDYFVPLHVRVRKARAAKADLFISIHADAWVERSANGSSVFALSEKGATSTAARWLANNQNEADLIGGVNLKGHERMLASVLLDLSTTAQIKDSLDLGRVVLEKLGGVNRLHKASVEQAGFAVLKAPDIPSILIETAFISNPEEEAKLNDGAYQDKMSVAIAEGIQGYLLKRRML